MIEILWNSALIICAIFFISFTFVVVFGAPFLPTLKSRVPEALDLANLKPGDTLLELGSGDGRLLVEAAKRGVYSVGYELNPLLVMYSKITTFRYRKFIKIIWGNYWIKSWPKADAIFVFLLQPYMEKLDKSITQNYPKGIKLVSFAFKIESKKHSKENNGLYLYVYNKRLKNSVK